MTTIAKKINLIGTMGLLIILLINSVSASDMDKNPDDRQDHRKSNTTAQIERDHKEPSKSGYYFARPLESFGFGFVATIGGGLFVDGYPVLGSILTLAPLAADVYLDYSDQKGGLFDSLIPFSIGLFTYAFPKILYNLNQNKCSYEN